jgi:hypothetical protein
MAAINQVETKRTHRPENASYVAKVERHARNEIATTEYFFLASVGNPAESNAHGKPFRQRLPPGMDSRLLGWTWVNVVCSLAQEFVFDKFTKRGTH